MKTRINISKTPTNLGYVPSLDGVRAIAIILVMLVHANFRFGLNGGIGVAIFFALSGFLITTLLLEEFKKNNTISFKGFYIRRTMRLFPALYLMLGVVFVYACFFRSGVEQINIFQDIVSAALYVYNIAWYWGWSIKEILLYHTWSLGVEEQFYLLWPFLLLVFIKRNLIKQLSIFLMIFIAATWILKSYKLFPSLPGAIISESIFWGCAAALLRWKGVVKKISSLIASVIFISMLVLGVMPFQLPYYNLFFNISGILSCIIILNVVTIQNSFIVKILSNKIMTFIGKISYSLYLWHLPVFRIFAYHSSLPPVISFIAKFIVSFALAILSWYLIEKRGIAYGRKLSRKFNQTAV